MSNKTWIYISLAALGVALYLYYRSSASGTPKTASSSSTPAFQSPTANNAIDALIAAGAGSGSSAIYSILGEG